MKDLLFQYLATANKTRAKITELSNIEITGDRAEIENELMIYREILGDLEFTIEWLRSGHNPNINNAIENRKVYLVDPQVIESVIDTTGYNKVSSDEYIDYLQNFTHPASHALSRLSQRELEVFLMVECEKMSHQDVAEILNIKKTSIQNYVERAKKKISKEHEQNLFLAI